MNRWMYNIHMYTGQFSVVMSYSDQSYLNHLIESKSKVLQVRSEKKMRAQACTTKFIELTV